MNIYVMPEGQIGGHVADQLTRVVAAKPDALIAWTTGNTPLRTGIYEELVRREREGKLSFGRCRFVNPDEQLGLRRDHPQSYFAYMRRHLFDAIRYAADNWFIPDGAAPDPAAECAAMERFIRENGGIDYQLLGIGANGHICFIEPAPALPAASFVTKIAEANRRLYAPLFGSLDAVPTHAVTFGWGTAMRSRKLCLVAAGPEKAAIVARALLGDIATEVPATLLQLHADADIVLDEAAATELLAGAESRPDLAARLVVVR